MQTSKGDIVIELNAKKAPVTVKNFVDYVNEGHYSGKIFHRVIKGFMIQGGNFDIGMKRAATKAQIVNEASNGLKNVRGSIAMARTNNPNSATDQFYINHGNNASLDYANRPPGYAVFGKVIAGMETVDAIASVQTGARDVPVTPVIIISAKVVTN
jgi:cyclophilin family peptidyl-prolyl cis-trans isomerase